MNYTRLVSEIRGYFIFDAAKTAQIRKEETKEQRTAVRLVYGLENEYRMDLLVPIDTLHQHYGTNLERSR